MTKEKGKLDMPEPQRTVRKHQLQIEGREKLTATGIKKVDFFSDELITAQTDLGQLNIKGEGLHIENLNSDSGDMLVTGKVGALSYTESGPALSFFGRIFK